MKYFNQSFKEKLQEVIEEIESQSLVEVVVVAKPRSSKYADVPLGWGIGAVFATFTFLMFSHIEFPHDLFYAITLASFVVGMLIPLAIKPAMRLFIGKTRMRKAVEIMGRAFFQKAGIRHTQDEIGVLFYVSVFEKQEFVLPDRGAANEVPQEEWEAMQDRLSTVFSADDPASQLLKELRDCAPIFSAFIPPIENDINELPDYVDVSL